MDISCVIYINIFSCKEFNYIKVIDIINKFFKDLINLKNSQGLLSKS
jgi:hypothetical protein